MDDDFLGLGVVVKHVLNANMVGVVIGYEGSLVLIRLANMHVIKLHEYELMPTTEQGTGEEADNVDEDNVIDFTKARDLRTAKARGAA